MRGTQREQFMKLLMDFTCLLDIRCALGESPVLDDRRKLLFFVDVMGPAIHAVRLGGTGLQTWPMPKPVGSIGLAESGRLLNGTGNFFCLLYTSPSPRDGLLSRMPSSA